jgi:hypothetical protein
VTFESACIQAGESFSAPIGRGLQARLTPADRGVWRIDVGPGGAMTDYLWVVSPPLQTAPHLLIGDGYGVPAWQSVRTTPRRFQFVTNESEYEAALALVERARRDDADVDASDIQRQGTGTLELWITDFGMSDDEDILKWISLQGRACFRRGASAR